MDFDIGNFLYILLMLVFVILGSLGKKKKPGITVQNIQEPEKEPETRDIPADIFEENLRKYFLPEDPEVKKEPEVIYDSADYTPETAIDTPTSPHDKFAGIIDTPVSEEGTYTTYRIEDHINEITMLSKQDHMQFRTTIKTDFVKRALKNFDPKKAILYKEVFEPKYF